MSRRSFDPRRVSTFAVLIAVAVSAVVLAPIARTALRDWRQEQADRPHPTLASEQDWRAIVELIRESGDLVLEVSPPPPPPLIVAPKNEITGTVVPALSSKEQPEGTAQHRPLVLQSTTLELCEDEDPVIPIRPPCTQAPQPSSGITSVWVDVRMPLRLRRELVLANVGNIQVPTFDDRVFQRASKDEILASFAKDRWWKGSYERFPGTAGMAAITQPVLSEDGHKALIYTEARCDGMCGQGVVYLLERNGSGCKIALRHRLWVS